MFSEPIDHARFVCFRKEWANGVRIKLFYEFVFIDKNTDELGERPLNVFIWFFQVVVGDDEIEKLQIKLLCG